MMWGDYGWGMGFGMIGMVLFWILVVLAIVLLVKWISASASGSSPPPAKSALDILKERYARGEIDQPEFEEKRRALDN